MIRKLINKWFPLTLHEYRYVEATLTKVYGSGDGSGWIDTRRSKTWKAVYSWKNERYLPPNVTPIEEHWYIERRLERLIFGLPVIHRSARVRLDGHEITARVCFGDPWPSRVWEAWKNNNLLPS